jgi:hypothetical protein
MEGWGGLANFETALSCADLTHLQHTFDTSFNLITLRSDWGWAEQSAGTYALRPSLALRTHLSVIRGDLQEVFNRLHWLFLIL